MKDNLGISTGGRIGTLLAVMASAVMFGCLAAAFMVMNYSPSGNYLLKNVILSPQTAEEVNKSAIILEHLEFSQWDAASKQWRTQGVNLEQYKAFYALVENDQSLKEPGAEILDAFYRTHPSKLTLFVRSTIDPHPTVKSFQAVQFADRKDYYRVELHVDTADEAAKWAYFFHPDIESKVKGLFSQPNNLR